MPLAVLTADLGLLFEIFFLILVGMILGLALISLNLQRILENIVVSLMIFYESKSMKIMVLKNLSVHRENNRMTAIIYSLTLGTIIFIIVMANIQIAVATSSGGASAINFEVLSYLTHSSDIETRNFTPETLEPIFEKNADIINEWAYVTLNSDELIYPTCGDFYLSPAATPTKFVDGGDDSLYSYSPSTMLDETFAVKSYNHSTSLGFTEQLYTAAGTQSIAHYWDMSDRLPTYDQH